MLKNLFIDLLNRKKIILIIILLVAGIYGAYQPIPKEIGMQGPIYELADEAVTFLLDETYLTAEGESISEQTIFTEVMKMIAEAEKYILVDMFLWNPFQGTQPETHRLLSSELTDALIAKKQSNPDIIINVVSDPLNTVYDGQPSYQFEALKAAGIPVFLTNHGEMRDSNPLYSAFWRGLLQWPDMAHTALVGAPYTFRLFPNALNTGGEPVPLRSYLKLFNFKANHRKLIVADVPTTGGRSMASLVTSANPHDGSSRHSNVALRVEGGVWRDIVKSEQMVASFSGGVIPDVPEASLYQDRVGKTSVALITELAIQDKVIALLNGAKEGATVDLAMFYFSEDKIIDALIDASNRGVAVRVILDPNKDAFGREKNGVPNRPVAYKLVRESAGQIGLRWCATHGEQCHSKMLLVADGEKYALTLGSANYTRRNLKNINLETNIYVESKDPSQAYTDAKAYFDRMWNNEQERLYTLDYEAYRDESTSKRVQSWVMENTGLSTF